METCTHTQRPTAAPVGLKSWGQGGGGGVGGASRNTWQLKGLRFEVPGFSGSRALDF